MNLARPLKAGWDRPPDNCLSRQRQNEYFSTVAERDEAVAIGSSPALKRRAKLIWTLRVVFVQSLSESKR